MKVSGSHVEKIESTSQNIFRIKEEQTIKIVTEKLSKEGKHVINIIHGTPSSLLGTVTKSITFLWEADDEDERYINAVKQEALERHYESINSKERKKAVYMGLVQESVALKQRINYAEIYKKKGTISIKDIRNPTPLWFGLGSLLFGLLFCLPIGLITEAKFLIICSLLFVAFSGWLFYDFFCSENNDAKKKREELIKKAKADAEILDSLKHKQAELSKEIEKRKP